MTVVMKTLVQNQEGLHLRAAAELTRLVSRFKSSVTVRKEKTSANGKSVIGLLTLMAGRGTTLEIILVGEDAKELASKIKVFLKMDSSQSWTHEVTTSFRPWLNKLKRESENV